MVRRCGAAGLQAAACCWLLALGVQAAQQELYSTFREGSERLASVSAEAAPVAEGASVSAPAGNFPKAVPGSPPKPDKLHIKLHRKSDIASKKRENKKAKKESRAAKAIKRAKAKNEHMEDKLIKKDDDWDMGVNALEGHLFIYAMWIGNHVNSYNINPGTDLLIVNMDDGETWWRNPNHASAVKISDSRWCAHKNKTHHCGMNDWWSHSLHRNRFYVGGDFLTDNFHLYFSDRYPNEDCEKKFRSEIPKTTEHIEYYRYLSGSFDMKENHRHVVGQLIMDLAPNGQTIETVKDGKMAISNMEIADQDTTDTFSARTLLGIE